MSIKNRFSVPLFSILLFGSFLFSNNVFAASTIEIVPTPGTTPADYDFTVNCLLDCGSGNRVTVFRADAAGGPQAVKLMTALPFHFTNNNDFGFSDVVDLVLLVSPSYCGSSLSQCQAVATSSYSFGSSSFSSGSPSSFLLSVENIGAFLSNLVSQLPVVLALFVLVLSFSWLFRFVQRYLRSFDSPSGVRDWSSRSGENASDWERRSRD